MAMPVKKLARYSAAHQAVFNEHSPQDQVLFDFFHALTSAAKIFARTQVPQEAAESDHQPIHASWNSIPPQYRRADRPRRSAHPPGSPRRMENGSSFNTPPTASPNTSKGKMPPLSTHDHDAHHRLEQKTDLGQPECPHAHAEKDEKFKISARNSTGRNASAPASPTGDARKIKPHAGQRQRQKREGRSACTPILLPQKAAEAVGQVFHGAHDVLAQGPRF